MRSLDPQFSNRMSWDYAYQNKLHMLKASHDSSELTLPLEVSRLALPITGTRVLQLFCGDGRELAYLVGSNATGVGVDFSSFAIAAAREYCAKPDSHGGILLW
jgi:ubiquinone/menaquinone biosynthesis C-methylase UbiE